MKKKNKFFTKILIVLIGIVIIINVFKFAEYFKKYSDYKVIIDNNGIILSDEIYVDDNIIYMSINDIKKYIDSEIYVEKLKDNSEIIVTTSRNNIACIKENDKNIEINGISKRIKSGAIKKAGIYYLPISEMNEIYNAEINYYNDILDIEYLYKSEIVGYINNKTKLKLKNTNFSRSIQKLQKGEMVTIIEKLDNDWSKVKTENGKIGYIKSSKISNESELRQNIDFSIYNKIDINSDDVRELTQEDIKAINGSIDSYNDRKELIKQIADSAIQNKLEGVNVKFSDISNIEKFYRFLIELRPYLNDYGISLIVTKTDKLDENRLKSIANLVV